MTKRISKKDMCRLNHSRAMYHKNLRLNHLQGNPIREVKGVMFQPSRLFALRIIKKTRNEFYANDLLRCFVLWSGFRSQNLII